MRISVLGKGTPTVPGRETTFITGHSNRYHPDDPQRGVFTRLQNVRTGDTLVLTRDAGAEDGAIYGFYDYARSAPMMYLPLGGFAHGEGITNTPGSLFAHFAP